MPFALPTGATAPFCIGALIGVTIGVRSPFGVSWGEWGGYLTTFSRKGVE
jgi:hypothetical protein